MSKDDLLRKGLKVPHIPWFSVNGRVLRLRAITMFGWIHCLKPVLVLGKWLNGKKYLLSSIGLNFSSQKPHWAARN